MAYTTPTVRATGDLITASIWNTDIVADIIAIYPVIFDVVVGRGLAGDPAAPAATIDSNTILGGNIPATYKHLRLVMNLRGDTAAASVEALLRFNNDSAANYTWQVLSGQNATASASTGAAASSVDLFAAPAASTAASYAGHSVVNIPDYTGTTFNKGLIAESGGVVGAAVATNLQVRSTAGEWASTAAITRLAIFPVADNWIAGTRVTLYGSV